jgi:hypothetical protein
MSYLLFVFLQVQSVGTILGIGFFIYIFLLAIASSRTIEDGGAKNIESDINNTIDEKLISNTDIRVAGFELMSSGKKILTGIVIIVFLFPANILLYGIFYLFNKNFTSAYSTNDILPVIPLLYLFNIIMTLIAIIYLVNGVLYIRNAGERLYKNK